MLDGRTAERANRETTLNIPYRCYIGENDFEYFMITKERKRGEVHKLEQFFLLPSQPPK